MKKNDWLLVIATALYSWLFYKEAAGINFLLFSIVLTAFLLLRDPSLLKKGKWMIVASGTIISGVAAALYGNWLSVWANIISLSLLSGVSVSTRSSVIITLFHSAYSYGSSMVFMILDAVERKNKRQQETKGTSFFGKLLLVLIPLLVTLLFFFLYRGSNAIFNNFAKNIKFDFITWQWIFFTLLGFLLLYGFFYHRRIREVAGWDENAPGDLAYREVKEEEQDGLFGIRNEYISGILLFAMLNILLLIVNLLDVQYVYISKVLPEGLNHSEYVHQGIELLILSIVIAIGIILFVFRGKMNFYSKSKTLRMLAALWIVQNMFMVISTIIRNNMYVTEYGGLTYKRIGVYVYLGLSLIGLITTWIKIWKLKSNWFLFRINSASWYCMLVIASLISWDTIITSFNISHAKDLKELDKGYLIDLAPSTLPEMLAYNDTSDLLRKEVAHDNTTYSPFRDGSMYYGDRMLENKLHGKLYWFLDKLDKTGWQSWNYDDARIEKEINILAANGKIKHLSLSMHGLQTLAPLHSLSMITSLDAGNNVLNRSLGDLALFPSLQKLNISSNGIDSLEQLPLLAKLRELDLTNNYPHSLAPLKNAPALTSLTLSSCRYVNVNELPALQHLDTLDISGNSIYSMNELNKFKSLRNLVMRNVSVSYGANESFPCIPSLRSLDISGNTIQGKNNLLLDGAVRCWNLEELNISGNQLYDLYGVTRTINGLNDSSPVALVKLRVLDAQRNNLQSITDIEQFSLLQELNISANQVTTLYPLSALTDLRTLYAGSNPLTNIDALTGLTKLELLDISSCNMDMPAGLKGLTNLRWLNLSSTLFSNTQLLTEMKELRSLYLQNTRINDLAPLSGLTKLETLNISNNNIRNYTPLYSLKQLKELYVSRIPAAQLSELRQKLPNTKIIALDNDSPAVE